MAKEITNDFLDQMIFEMKKEETQEKMKVLMDPAINFILSKLKPYILFLFSTFFILIVLLLYILVDNIRQSRKRLN